MNLPQRVVLTVGLLLIALSFAFPWSHYPSLEYTGISFTRPDFFAFDRPLRTIKFSWVALQALTFGALTASGYFIAGYWSADPDRSSEHGKPSAAKEQGK